MIDVVCELMGVMLGCASDEVMFISCGSESDNFVIDGVVCGFLKKNVGCGLLKIVMMVIEYLVVIEYLKVKVVFGELTYELVGVDEEGLVNADDVIDVIDENMCLVMVMYVNNEMGVI